jgi:exosome complex RNA-binding protein Rrp42 (RNase PH superfamily)
MPCNRILKLTVFRVIARISIDVTTPLPERKFDGVFQIVTEFSPMASPAFEIGRYVCFDAHGPRTQTDLL